MELNHFLFIFEHVIVRKEVHPLQWIVEVMMVKTSSGLEPKLSADKVFLEELNYIRLPRIKEDSPMPDPIADIWTVVVLLIEPYNEIGRASCRERV